MMLEIYRVPEISYHCPTIPFILVGTKIDLRDDAQTINRLAQRNEKPMTLSDGKKLAMELEAFKYLECSALSRVSK